MEIKRAYEGTEHTLSSDTKIGGPFKKEKNAPFISERAKYWDTLYNAQEEKKKNLPHDKIEIIFNEKTIEGISNETTPYEIGVKHMKKSLLKECLVAKVLYTKNITENISTNIEEEEHELQGVEKKENYIIYDLNRPLISDCKLELCTFQDKEGKNTFWHSSAHLLGAAIENLYGAKLCTGPALEEGFYYDSYMGTNVIDSNDFNKIEEEMKNLSKGNHPFQRLTMSKNEALELFKANPFKVQLITNKVKDNELTTAYKCGDFIDLCLGPHIPNLNLIKAVKITKNSATNWLAKVTNDSLQRVYGISFLNEKELKEYIHKKEEEEKRDHRNIGKQQGLFMFHNLSPGSCFWYYPGSHIFNKLIDFMRNQYIYRDYQEVISPNIFNLKLWKTSGHYKNYKENLFLMKVENQGFGLKPMNCPGHCLMFDNVARSYKELPIRMADFGVLHRNEVSGALSGLTRVRRFQQDDAHIFCRYDQIMDEVLGFLDFMSYVYDVFGFKYELYLSTRPEKMLGTKELWDMAEKSLKDALDKFGKPWKLNPGDGAFYGPKIDIKLFDALGRAHQCGTVQLDFQLPIRFNLMYKTDEQIIKDNNKEEKKKNDNEKLLGKEIYKPDEWDDDEFIWEEKDLKPGYARPCIVHRAILGSVERCSAILIEHYGGKWPFWLSPYQVAICTINDKVNDYAEKCYLIIKCKGYQVYWDKSNNTLNKKIRNAQISQYNIIIVIGQEEVNGNCLDIRTRDGNRVGKKTINELLEYFKELEPKKSQVELDMLKKLGIEEKNKENIKNEFEKSKNIVKNKKEGFNINYAIIIVLLAIILGFVYKDFVKK